MNVFRFTEFEVYQDAKKFRKLIRKYLHKIPKSEQYKLIDQIDRAALSVVLNIAEGSGKKTDKDFANFLQISAGSVNEVIAGFDIALDDQHITQIEYNEIKTLGASVVNQLGGFMKILRQR
jgi:four helix bundle protein